MRRTAALDRVGTRFEGLGRGIHEAWCCDKRRGEIPRVVRTENLWCSQSFKASENRRVTYVAISLPWLSVGCIRARLGRWNSQIVTFRFVAYVTEGGSALELWAHSWMHIF